MKHLILDVETQKTFDDVGGYYPEKLMISFVGVIERHVLPTRYGEKVTEYRHELFEKDLHKLWRMIETTDLIIGFNLDGFDMQTFKPYYHGDVTALPTLDLMIRFKEKAGHRISLDSIATETLGTQKSGDGLDAIRYYRDGELDKLASYCMKDVEITRDIYDFGRINGTVRYKNKWNEVSDMEVDFGYQPEEESGFQMSLV